jgi:flagellar hook-associated protein 2
MATTAVSSTTNAASTATPALSASQLAASNKAAAQSLINSLSAGSGTDVNALAQNLVSAEKTPLANAINTKITKNESKISGLSAVSYVVSQVQTALTALKDQSSYNTLSVANSNTTAFDMTAGTSAVTGSHDVEVLRLARSQRTVSQSMASGSVSLNGGNAMSLTLTTGKGVSATISVVAGSDTPQGVVDAINASTDAKTAGVTAQLVNTGDGSVAPYKIVLTGLQGAQNSFNLSGLGNTSTGLTPTVSTSQGVPSTITETSGVTFTALTAGQTVRVAGLTYTATANTTAAQVASAFSNLAVNTSKNGFVVDDGGGQPIGKLDGTLTGFSTGALSGTAITFTSATPGTIGTHISPVTGAVSLVTAPVLPGVSSIPGDANALIPTQDSSDVTFTDLLAGQTVTVGGMIFKATVDVTADQVTQAFAGLTAGTSKSNVSVSDSQPTTIGTLNGTLTGYDSALASAGGGVLTFTSTAAPSGAAITVATGTAVLVSAPTAPAVQTTTGITQRTESSSVTFKPMSAGQTVTVAGLTYTATDTTTAAEVAAAFSGIQSGGALPTGLTKGLFSGSLSGFNAGASSAGNAGLTFTSTSNLTNVTDIAVSISQTVFLPTEASNQTAVDAQVKVDGVSYTRSSNTLTDVVKGATLNLKALTTAGSPASVQLTRDNTAVTTNINALVTAYNDAMSMLSVVADPKSTLPTYGATMVGDSTVRMVKQQLKSLFFGTSSTPGTKVGALWQLGLSVDQAGVLTADSTKLTSALTDNYEDVVKTLTGNQNNVTAYGTTPAGIAGDAYRKLDKLLSATGPLITRSTNATNQNSKYQEDLTKLNTRMDSMLARYQKQFAAMNSMVGSVNSQKTSLKATFDGMMATYTGKTG